MVKSQATRSRSQNRTIARQLLADKLDALNNGDSSRAAIVGSVRAKKKASSAKKSRRKYRKLAEQGQDQQAETEETEEAETQEEAAKASDHGHSRKPEER